MLSITKKSQVKEIIKKCVGTSTDNHILIAELVHEQLLQSKVRFPLLEYATELLDQHIPKIHQLEFCDSIEQYKTIGGNVILGKMLQLRLQDNYEEVIHKATEYIQQGNEWYVCDIIGERVFGVALLSFENKAILTLQKLSTHQNKWVVRSIGPGVHYAVKKGLNVKATAKLFPVLLSLSSTKEYHIKKGIGWAAKTSAKFHPHIIEQFHREIFESQTVGKWFQTKVKIGLKRSEYAKNNRG